MTKKIKTAPRTKARLPKGMRDIEAPEIRGVAQMVEKIREIYERYGFEPLDTPAFEYTDALGKFLPDQDRPNEGVFSFQDEDEQWLSLRYDLTAPLARYVAQNYDGLPKPFRRYSCGPVWRNEKPGPGRFRQFLQFDADTVGTDNVAADAEMCMLAADALEALGIARGEYVIRVNSRKVLDGVMDAAGIPQEKRLVVLRAIDKLDRLNIEDVQQLLGPGREDKSGDFTPGATLQEEQINLIISIFRHGAVYAEEVTPERFERDPLGVSVYEDPKGLEEPFYARVTFESVLKTFAVLRDKLTGDLRLFDEGVAELQSVAAILGDYDDTRIRFDPSVVRGLEYYTGLVFEAELTFRVKDDDGRLVRFGSVGGGGRYDGLVSRFRGAPVPATGFSIGVSRLYAALKALDKIETGAARGPVVVLVMDHDRTGDYAKLTQTLRRAGIRAEMYLGTSGMRAQMKYADKRGSPCVVIQGEDERARGEVQIKDMILGEELSQEITDNQEWREGRPAQFSVPQDDMVEAVRSVLARHGS